MITFVIVDLENKDIWRWFLSKLIKDIGDVKEHGWDSISDQLNVLSMFSSSFFSMIATLYA